MSISMKNSNLLILSVLMVCGCSSRPFVVHHDEAFTGRGVNDIYIVSHGWHTGFVIPAETIGKAIPELGERFGDAPYIEIGWGDKGFYQAKEITSGLTVRAIFWPTESVIHSVSVPEKVQAYFANSDVERLCLTDGELASLVRFITQSFYRNEEGQIVPLKNGLYGDSQFYKGVGDYYLMNTCNKWTAKGLKSIGMGISPTFKLTAGSVMDYLESELPQAAAMSVGHPVATVHCTAH